MKTEKQVKKILETVDERIIDCFRSKSKEYSIRATDPNVENKRIYCERLVALHALATEMGYDWHKDIDDGVERIKPHTVMVVRHKVTEGF